jgi:hypothetical protein
MRRTLILGLGLLVLSGCAAYRTASTQYYLRYNVLQNPAYPGDANKDLVPYRARDRDGADCGRDKAVQAQADVVSLPGTHPTVWAALEDPAVWNAMLEPFFACMAARGWRAP